MQVTAVAQRRQCSTEAGENGLGERGANLADAQARLYQTIGHRFCSAPLLVGVSNADCQFLWRDAEIVRSSRSSAKVARVAWPILYHLLTMSDNGVENDSGKALTLYLTTYMTT